MKIAVIGAGASGLPAIKTCLDEGLNPVCFERRDGLGGLWRYEETPIQDRTTVISSTVSNTSKETSCYSDFPFPDNFPNFLHHSKMLEYLKMYADHFDLEKYVRFQTEVLNISKADDFLTTGRWAVEYKDSVAGTVTCEIFDGVLVCNGHLSTPLLPAFPGSDAFTGIQIHSQTYKNANGFENKRVLLVGLGNTSADIAADLANVCSQVYVSTRRGSWIAPRLDRSGVPRDSVVKRRVFNARVNLQPRFLTNYVQENQLFDHSLYGLKPEHPFDAQHPLTNDALPALLASGRVALRGDVKFVKPTGVIFDDGSVEDKIDVIVYCTGFRFDFPFLREPSYRCDNNVTNLYKFVFAPDTAGSPHTLAVIGCVQPYGSVLPAAELQARWAVMVLKGDRQLPSEEDMLQDIEKRRNLISSRYLNTPRHAIQVEWIDYLDEIAWLIGCKPNCAQLFLTDPTLAMALLFGPCVPSHYRLVGRGSWIKARDTILTTWKRIEEPLKVKVKANNEVQAFGNYFGKHWLSWISMFFGLFMLLACVVVFYAA